MDDLGLKLKRYDFLISIHPAAQRICWTSRPLYDPGKLVHLLLSCINMYQAYLGLCVFSLDLMTSISSLTIHTYYCSAPSIFSVCIVGYIISDAPCDPSEPCVPVWSCLAVQTQAASDNVVFGVPFPYCLRWSLGPMLANIPAPWFALLRS